jgi:ABC-type nitrate/sulfonate/bicarbonate transport system permease component
VVIAAFRIAFSIGMVLTIAAEMIVSRDGVGRFIAFAGQLLETERVFAGLTLAGLIGLIGYQVIDWGERRLIRWRRDRHLQL